MAKDVYARQRAEVVKAFTQRAAQLKEGGPGSGRRPGPGSFVGVSIKHKASEFGKKAQYAAKFDRVQKAVAARTGQAAIARNSAAKHARLGDVSPGAVTRADAKLAKWSARLKRVRSLRPPDLATPPPSGKGSWRVRPKRRVA